MALPGFGSAFYAAALFNSILAIALGFFSSAIIFVLRLLALGSMRSGRCPTAWLRDVSSASLTKWAVLTTQANNQFTASDCNVAVKLKDRCCRDSVFLAAKASLINHDINQSDLDLVRQKPVPELPCMYRTTQLTRLRRLFTSRRL